MTGIKYVTPNHWAALGQTVRLSALGLGTRRALGGGLVLATADKLA